MSARLLTRARRMSEACGAASPDGNNPGMMLGAALGELALAKRDKVTFLCSPSLAAFPAWVEQLIAESTGKDRKGHRAGGQRKLGAPEKYGADRFFVYLRLPAMKTMNSTAKWRRWKPTAIRCCASS